MKKIALLQVLICLCILLVNCTTINKQDLLDYQVTEKQFIVDSTLNKDQLYSSVCQKLFDKWNNNQNQYFLDRNMGVISIHTNKKFGITETAEYWTLQIEYFMKIEIRDNKMRVTISPIAFKGWDFDWYEESYNPFTMQSTKYYDKYRRKFYNEFETLTTTISRLLTEASTPEIVNKLNDW